jgi:mannose-6-phosphate isomerase
VVLEAGTESRIYAGLKPGTTATICGGRSPTGRGGHLACFTPKPGDGVFIPAGTVHTLGGDVVVFEIQQNSDVTFRLYDWGHVDAKTGKPRELEVDQALACIDFANGSAGGLVSPVVEAGRRWTASDSLIVNFSGCGACADNRRSPSAPRVCRACWLHRGRGQVEHNGATHVGKGEMGRCGRSCCPRRDLTGNCDTEQSAAGRGERAGDRDTRMKKLIVYDLDGTLAESKSSLDAEMSRAAA